MCYLRLQNLLLTEKLDVTVISSLVEATLHCTDDALTPGANWGLALRDMEKSLEDSQDHSGQLLGDSTLIIHYTCTKVHCNTHPHKAPPLNMQLTTTTTKTRV